MAQAHIGQHDKLQMKYVLLSISYQDKYWFLATCIDILVHIIHGRCHNSESMNESNLSTDAGGTSADAGAALVRENSGMHGRQASRLCRVCLPAAVQIGHFGGGWVPVCVLARAAATESHESTFSE